MAALSEQAMSTIDVASNTCVDPPTPRETQSIVGTPLSRALDAARVRKSLYVRVSEVLLVLTYVMVFVIAALLMWQLIANAAGFHVFAWAIAGFFVAVTRHYIRIILMVPIYSIESWLALRFEDQKTYFETARDLYESLVIYAFFQLLLEFLGGKARLSARLLARPHDRARHLPPCCCLRGWRLGSRFVHRCMVGVYQYVFLRCIVSIIALICEATGVYHEGNWSPKYFYVYSSIIINTSQCWALYVLALFYIETRDDLKPLKPLGKFAVVKAVVFVAWWQSIAVSALATFHVIKPAFDYSEEEISKGIQDLIICLEMLLAALAHKYYFPVSDFWSADGALTPLMQMQRAAADFDQNSTRTADGVDDAVNTIDGVVDASQGKLEAVSAEPLGLTTALKEVMPGDMLGETADHLRSGFGLVHKWEKRRTEVKEARAKVEEWNAKGHARKAGFAQTSPRTKRSRARSPTRRRVYEQTYM